jgi:hypothetical protein
MSESWILIINPETETKYLHADRPTYKILHTICFLITSKTFEHDKVYFCALYVSQNKQQLFPFE